MLVVGKKKLEFLEIAFISIKAISSFRHRSAISTMTKRFLIFTETYSTG
jgi:hypothetical protein